MCSQDEEQSQIEAKNDRKIKTGTDLHKVNDENRSTGLWTHHVLKLKHAFVTFHFTQESVLLDFLGVRTWLTHSDTRSMTNMEFSGAGHARSHSESHHYSVV